MRATLLAAFALANILTATAAVAGDQDFTLLNKTGYEIEKVYVSAVNAKSWEEDILGKDTLEDGSSVNISFKRSESACRWDMMVVYADGDKATWTNLNLCRISKVTLFWDRKNEVTRATLD
jgi:hypothetical protein